MARPGRVADLAGPSLQVLPGAPAGSAAARPKGLAALHLGRRYQENPNVPGDVADHERAEGHADRAEQSPVRACHGGRTDERGVLGHDVRAAVQRRGGEVSGAALNEAAPEELLSRPDHKSEARGELLLRAERAQRVDVADLFTATRHDLTGDGVADAEDAVQARRRDEPEQGLARADAHPARLAIGGECQST